MRSLDTKTSATRSIFHGLRNLFDFVERALGSDREPSTMDDEMLRDLVITKARSAGLRNA